MPKEVKKCNKKNGNLENMVNNDFLKFTKENLFEVFTAMDYCWYEDIDTILKRCKNYPLGKNTFAQRDENAINGELIEFYLMRRFPDVFSKAKKEKNDICYKNSLVIECKTNQASNIEEKHNSWICRTDSEIQLLDYDYLLRFVRLVDYQKDYNGGNFLYTNNPLHIRYQLKYVTDVNHKILKFT